MVMAKDELAKRLIERIGQTVLTCPTTACFDGLPEAPDRVKVGSALKYFGDGFQASKVIGGERYWRIPVMEGEFLVAGDVRHGEVHGRRELPHPGTQMRTGHWRRPRRPWTACTACRASSFRSPAGWSGAGARSAASAPRQHDRIDQRRVLPHASRRDRDGAARHGEFGARDRGQRPRCRCRSARRCAPASTPPACTAWWRSPRATTAGSSVPITSSCGRSWAGTAMSGLRLTPRPTAPRGLDFGAVLDEDWTAQSALSIVAPAVRSARGECVVPSDDLFTIAGTPDGTLDARGRPRRGPERVGAGLSEGRADRGCCGDRAGPMTGGQLEMSAMRASTGEGCAGLLRPGQHGHRPARGTRAEARA